MHLGRWILSEETGSASRSYSGVLGRCGVRAPSPARARAPHWDYTIEYDDKYGKFLHATRSHVIKWTQYEAWLKKNEKTQRKTKSTAASAAASASVAAREKTPIVVTDIKELDGYGDPYKHEAKITMYKNKLLKWDHDFKKEMATLKKKNASTRRGLKHQITEAERDYARYQEAVAAYESFVEYEEVVLGFLLTVPIGLVAPFRLENGPACETLWQASEQGEGLPKLFNIWLSQADEEKIAALFQRAAQMRNGELAQTQPTAQSGQQLTQQQAPAQPAAHSGQQLTEQQAPSQPTAQSGQQLTQQQAPAQPTAQSGQQLTEQQAPAQPTAQKTTRSPNNSPDVEKKKSRTTAVEEDCGLGIGIDLAGTFNDVTNVQDQIQAIADSM